MITSDYGRSALDTPHPPTPAAQLQPAAISATSSRIGAVQVSAYVHTTSPHTRCAQAPTPINFDDPHKVHYADVRIMPTSVRSVLVSTGRPANLVGIIPAP
jgi:hypothetical protein